MKTHALVLLLILFVSSDLLAQSEPVLSADARNFAGSGVKVEVGVFPTIQIPLGNSGIWTVVNRTKYRDEDALLFYVIKMPNGYGRLFVTKTVLAYEPEGGYNVNAFTIDRKAIKSVDYQQNWQTVRNYPNVNVEYDKDRKQFGINRTVGSSPYAQIDLERYYTAINYLHKAVKDFESALGVFDELVARKRYEIQAEEDTLEAVRLATEEAERRKIAERAEELRKAKLRLEEKLTLAEKFAQDRRIYDEEVQKHINLKRPQLKGEPAATRKKVELAVKALRTLSAASEVGVIFSEYSSRLIDTKAAVDEAVEVLPENLLNSELQLAIRAYVDAGQGWNKMNKDEVLSESDESFWILINRYPLQPDISNPEFPILRKEPFLSTLWQRANLHMRNAASLSSF